MFDGVGAWLMQLVFSLVVCLRMSVERCRFLPHPLFPLHLHCHVCRLPYAGDPGLGAHPGPVERSALGRMGQRAP